MSSNDDHTLTSPLPHCARSSGPLLCLSIVWHPDLELVGHQFFSALDITEVNRYAPLFHTHGKDGSPLASQCISRNPVKIMRGDNESLTIIPSESRMHIEVNGKQIYSPVNFSRRESEQGVILFLGRAVVISINWVEAMPKENPVPGFIGISPAAQKSRDLIRYVAPLKDTVLLLGETGTGKEVAATAIHSLGKAGGVPMVCVNMAALSESLATADLFGAVKGAYTGAHTSRRGWFAEAENTTLFLDEIGNAPETVQPMLLRVLETGCFRPLGSREDLRSNARIIAATDQDLYNGNFNQALLRRLESHILVIPPLRSRKEDIGILLLHLIKKYEVEKSIVSRIDAALVNQMANYDWPGNVRQLTHVFKRLVLQLGLDENPNFAHLVEPHNFALSDTGKDLENHYQNAKSKDRSHRARLADFTEQDVLNAMEENEWYIQGAAQWLGISRPSMYQLLKKHPDIRRPELIDPDEIRDVIVACKGDFEKMASRLKTPTEALRRFIGQVIK